MVTWICFYDIKKQEWQNSISSVKYMTIIHVLEHGTQQFTGDASILRVANEAWYLLPTNLTWRTHGKPLVFTIAVSRLSSSMLVNGFTPIIKFIFIVLLAKTIAHKTGSPVAAVNPRTVKWQSLNANWIWAWLSGQTNNFSPPMFPSFFCDVLHPTSSTKRTLSRWMSSYSVFLPKASSCDSTITPSWLNHFRSSFHFIATPQSAMHVLIFSYIILKFWTVHQLLWKLSNWTAFFADCWFLSHQQNPFHHPFPMISWSLSSSSLLSSKSWHKCLSFHELISLIMTESVTNNLTNSSPSLHVTGAFISLSCRIISSKSSSILDIGNDGPGCAMRSLWFGFKWDWISC